MLNPKQRATFQKVIIGAMLLGVFAFAFVRWFRLETNPKRAEKITYDSDLRDKIKNEPITVNQKPDKNTDPSLENGDIGYISEQVNQANSLFNSGQDERAIQILENAVNRALPKGEDKNNPDNKMFKNISDQIIIIQQDIKSGDKADVAKEIKELLKVLDSENQKVSQLK